MQLLDAAAALERWDLARLMPDAALSQRWGQTPLERGKQVWALLGAD